MEWTYTHTTPLPCDDKYMYLVYGFYDIHHFYLITTVLLPNGKEMWYNYLDQNYVEPFRDSIEAWIKIEQPFVL